MLDPNGTDAIWIQEAGSAEGFGHSGMMVQDSEGDWYYFFWGPESEDLSKQLIFGTELRCEVERIVTDGVDMTNKDVVINVSVSDNYFD